MATKKTERLIYVAPVENTCGHCQWNVALIGGYHEPDCHMAKDNPVWLAPERIGYELIEEAVGNDQGHGKENRNGIQDI